MAEVFVHINTIDQGAKVTPKDEWCMVKFLSLPIIPQVGDTLSLEVFEGWMHSGKANHPKVEYRVIEEDCVTLHINVRYHIRDLMGFREHLVQKGWRRCGGSQNPAFPVQWVKTEDQLPQEDRKLVTMRGPFKGFDFYSGGMWSVTVSAPDWWAYWDYDIDLGEWNSAVRFDTLGGIPDPQK